MTRKSPTKSARAGVTRRSFAAGAGAAGLLAGTAPFNIVRAQGGPLKIGVIGRASCRERVLYTV